jgi:hypothetical protein
MFIRAKKFNAVAVVAIVIGVVGQMGAVAFAATINVPADQPTIQLGINAATNGDTVLVAPGLYKEHLDFLGKQIVLLSTAGRDSTIVEGVLEKIPVVRFITAETNNSVLDGFTIQWARDVEGISCSGSSPIIRNCDINHCVEIGRGGRGIVIKGGAPKILYNRIHNNAGRGGGGGIYFATKVVGTGAEIAYNDIYNNWFGGIHAEGDNVGATSSHLAYIHHNLIRSNFGPGLALGTVYGGGSSRRIVSNTVVDNAHGIQRTGSSTADSIFNNIVISNAGHGISGTLGVYSDYNCVWDNDTLNDPGPNGISQNPLFVDALFGDFSLQAESPCIDAGNPDSVYNDPDSTRADIGAGDFTGPQCDPYWECPPINEGDVNNNGIITSADIIGLVNFCFKNGPAPQPCTAKGDCDCSGRVTAADVIFLVNYVLGGANPYGALLKGGGDSPCIICRLLQEGIWSCP